MSAHRRLGHLNDLNELRYRELALLQQYENAAPGEVTQGAHPLENAWFCSRIHKSG